MCEMLLNFKRRREKKLMETMVSFWLTAIVSRKWSSLSLLLSTPPMLNSVGLLSFRVDGFCMMANLMCRKMMRCSKTFAIAMLSCICRCCLFPQFGLCGFPLLTGFQHKNTPNKNITSLCNTHTYTLYHQLKYFLLVFINI